jgi:uncharacterized protein YecE (DUF72 family)
MCTQCRSAGGARHRGFITEDGGEAADFAAGNYGYRVRVHVRIGCSGWNYRHWRDRVYGGAPPSRWLELYARRFDTVEVNATFYRLPTRRAVAGWVAGTPEDFVLAVKASRYLTHLKRLRDLGPGLERFLERIGPLCDSRKLGPILWQLPATFHRDDARLADALARLPDLDHCFEFRHESWFHEDVYALLREHDVALVIGDAPTRPFQAHELTARWTYVRFHHGRRGRRGNYSETELQEWARRIRRWPVDRTWLYFNNDWEGFAVKNAERLTELLSGR